MSLMLPGSLEWVLEMLGFDWPKGDEDKLRECAQVWRDFADQVDDLNYRTLSAANSVRSANSGDSTDAFGRTVDKFTTGGDGYLADAATAARLIAATFDAAAVIVITCKIAVIAQLVLLAAEIIAAQAAAPFTFGLSELGALGATQATKMIVRRLLKELRDALLEAVLETLKEPVVSAVQGMISDLIAQTVNQGFGAQNGYDLGRTAKRGAEDFTDAAKKSGQTFTEALRDGAGSRAGGAVRHHAENAAGHGTGNGTGHDAADGGDSSTDPGPGPDSGGGASATGGTGGHGSTSPSSGGRTSAGGGPENTAGGDPSGSRGDGGRSDPGSSRPAPASAPAHASANDGRSTAPLDPFGTRLAADPAPAHTPAGDAGTATPSHTRTGADDPGGPAPSGGDTRPAPAHTPDAGPRPSEGAVPPARDGSDSRPADGPSGPVRAAGENRPGPSQATPTTDSGSATAQSAPASEHRPGDGSSHPSHATGENRPNPAYGPVSGHTAPDNSSGPAYGPVSGHTAPDSGPAPAHPADGRSTPAYGPVRGSAPAAGPDTPAAHPSDAPHRPTTTETASVAAPAAPSDRPTTAPGPDQATPPPHGTAVPPAGGPVAPGGVPGGVPGGAPGATTSRPGGPVPGGTAGGPSADRPSVPGRAAGPVRGDDGHRPVGLGQQPSGGRPAGVPGTGRPAHVPDPRTADRPSTDPRTPSSDRPSSDRPSSDRPSSDRPSSDRPSSGPRPDGTRPDGHGHPADPDHDAAPGRDHDGGPARRATDDRPLGSPGGLQDPSDRDHARVDDAVPRDADGRPQRHPDPNDGDWPRAINGDDPHAPGRNNNCVDVALATVDTYSGHPTPAAARTPDLDADGRPSDRGERGGRDRIENALGARFSDLGDGPEAYRRLEDTLRRNGHGSQAVIITRDADGRAHAWNAVNHNGRVTYVDAQSGRRSDRPLHSGDNGVFAIPLTPDRAPATPAPPVDPSHDASHDRRAPAEAAGADPGRSDGKKPPEELELRDRDTPAGKGEKLLDQLDPEDHGEDSRVGTEEHPDGYPLITEIDGMPVKQYLEETRDHRGAMYRDAQAEYQAAHEKLKPNHRNNPARIAALPGIAKADVGACTGVGIDRRTGMVVEAINGRRNEKMPRQELHPTLEARLKDLEAMGEDERPHPNKNITSHAEVKITNQLLWARERAGLPADESALAEMHMSVQSPFLSRETDESDRPVGDELGRPAPFCGNCDRMLKEVPSTAGRFTGFDRETDRPTGRQDR